MAIFSERSVAQGGSAWTAAEVRAPADLRPYRATVLKAFLGVNDRRTECDSHSRLANRRSTSVRRRVIRAGAAFAWTQRRTPHSWQLPLWTRCSCQRFRGSDYDSPSFVKAIADGSLRAESRHSSRAIT